MFLSVFGVDYFKVKKTVYSIDVLKSKIVPSYKVAVLFSSSISSYEQNKTKR